MPGCIDLGRPSAACLQLLMDVGPACPQALFAGGPDLGTEHWRKATAVTHRHSRRVDDPIGPAQPLDRVTDRRRHLPARRAEDAGEDMPHFGQFALEFGAYIVVASGLCA